MSMNPLALLMGTPRPDSAVARKAADPLYILQRMRQGLGALDQSTDPLSELSPVSRIGEAFSAIKDAYGGTVPQATAPEQGPPMSLMGQPQAPPMAQAMGGGQAPPLPPPITIGGPQPAPQAPQRGIMGQNDALPNMVDPTQLAGNLQARQVPDGNGGMMNDYYSTPTDYRGFLRYLGVT